MIKYQVVRQVLFLVLFSVIGLLSCETSVVKERTGPSKTVKEKKERDPRKVDMVKRMTRFISKRVEMDELQREQLKAIVQEYKVDSMSLEEFYYARIEMKERVINNVLTREQQEKFQR